MQGYFGAGSGTQNAVEQNKMAYKKYRLMPRCMVGVRNIDTKVTIFGTPLRCGTPTAGTGLLYDVVLPLSLVQSFTFCHCSPSLVATAV